MVRDGDTIHAGDIIAKKAPRHFQDQRISSAACRAWPAFEVRKPQDKAEISEIAEAMSHIGAKARGKRKLVVTPEIGGAREYLVAQGQEAYHCI